MRIGCCLNMIVPPEHGIGHALAAVARDVGFDYVELPLRRFAEIPLSAFRDLRRSLEACHIRCETCNDFLPAHVRITGPDVRQSIQHEYVTRACARAEELGVEVIVLGSAPARNVPNGFSHTRAVEQIREFLCENLAIFHRHRITIAIEHLNERESNILNSLASVSSLVASIGDAGICMLIDYYHLIAAGGGEAEIPRHLPNTAHIHVSVPPGRQYPDRSHAGLTRFLSLVTGSGYRKRISIEGYTRDLRADGPGSLAFLRSLTDGTALTQGTSP